MKSELQYKIFRFLGEHREINQADIAAYCGVTAQTFNYNLLHANRCDEVLEKNIIKYLEKHGEVMRTSVEECTAVRNEVLEFAGVIGYELDVLIKLTQEQIKDGILTDNERKTAEKRLDDMRENINAKIDEMKKVVRG
jgi:hypothetical protein